MMKSDRNDVNNQKGKSCTVRIERKRVLGKMKSSPLHDITPLLRPIVLDGLASRLLLLLLRLWWWCVTNRVVACVERTGEWPMEEEVWECEL